VVTRSIRSAGEISSPTGIQNKPRSLWRSADRSAVTAARQTDFLIHLNSASVAVYQTSPTPARVAFDTVLAARGVSDHAGPGCTSHDMDRGWKNVGF